MVHSQIVGCVNDKIIGVGELAIAWPYGQIKRV